MNDSSRWSTGIFITLVVIVGVGIYGVHKYHQNHAFVPPPAPNTSVSTPAPATPAPSTPAPAAPSCFPAAQAASKEGQNGCIQFMVGYTYTSAKGEMYLDQYSDYTSGFSVWIPSGYSFGPAALSQYANKTIDVTGQITSYNGAPEIEVTSASQIQLAQ